MGYNTFYMNNFIGRFNTALGCKITPGDLAKVLITLGCHKAPSKMWYRNEIDYVYNYKLAKVAQELNALGYNIKSVVSPSPYPMLLAKPTNPAATATSQNTSARSTATAKPQNTSANQQNVNVQQIKRPVVPIPAEDETNMDYVSYKLLKDNEVFYDHQDESIDDLIKRYGKMSIIKYIRSLD